MTNNRLASLPSLPSSTTRAHVPCACGCGRTTTRTFAPGHDARLKGGIVRVVRGLMTLKEVADVMGRPFAEAVRKAMADTVRMRAWGLEAEVKAARRAETKVEQPVEEKVEQAS